MYANRTILGFVLIGTNAIKQWKKTIEIQYLFLSNIKS